METLLYALLAGLLAGVTTAALTGLARHAHRVRIGASVLVLAGLVALLCGVGTLPAIAGTLVSIAALKLFWVLNEASLRKSAAMAPAVASYALANFDKLDIDGDGLLTQADLQVALDDEGLGQNERALVKRLRFDLSLAGHVIDSYVSMSPMSGAGTVINTYGASRADLESYARRVADEYAREYGA